MNETYIKEFIIDGGFLSEKDLEKVEEKMLKSKLSFISAVIELNLLKEKTIKKILDLLNGVKSISLKGKKIDLKTLFLIPEPIVKTKKIIPFEIKDNTISLAVSDTDIEYDFIRSIIPQKYNFEIFITDEEDIKEKIKEYQKTLRETKLDSIYKNLSNITKIEDFGYQKKEDLPKHFFDDIANNHYTEKFLRELMEYAKTSSASHIYITNGEEKNLVSFRIYGHNYPIMEIEKNTVFSISIKLKQLADINIFNQKEIIQNANFRAELNGEIDNIFLSFVKTVFGESITIELGEKKDFGTEFITLVDSQKDILYRNLNDEKGFYIISGEKQSGKTKTAYALMEYEVAKNKEIYSIEETIVHRINYVNQLLVEYHEKKNLLLTQVIQNKPDMIFIEHIKPYLVKILFNYVNLGGKLILGIKNDVKFLIENIMKYDFKKGNIIRNFNIVLEHKKFKLLKDEKKKTKLTKEFLKIINIYMSNEEILDLFLKQKLITKEEEISDLVFYIKGKGGYKKDEFAFVRGVTDLGLVLEASFLEKETIEKMKNSVKNAVKKSILENALILSHKGEVDLKEVLKFLTKA